MLRVAEQAFKTDVGRQRQANEDSYFVRTPVFVVADGMGGAQAGEVASGLAVEEFEAGERVSEPPESYLAEVVGAANRRIFAVASEDSSRSGMGTTITASMLEGEELSLAHVGDSRAYLYRDGELRQLTNDHSLVEEMRRQGKLTREEAEEHPQRSVILRALGVEPEVEIDTMTFRLRDDDLILLCTDGLTTMVTDERLTEILATADDLDSAARMMVREANENGGRDNITVGVFRVEEVEVPASAESKTLIGPSAAAEGLRAEAVGAGVARKRAQVEPPTRHSEPTPRRRRARIALRLLLGAAVLAALIAAALFGLRQVYFLGTDEAGRVALYRGLPYELPLDVDLYSERYSSPVLVSSVPEERRGSVTDHKLRSHDDAADLISDLEQTVREQRATGPPGPSGQ